ncbi:MAG: hypothetical protein E4H36_00415 [Spirochaetales bacterium]|nr:MAG: hypothetical protein E4H36_00415 [Spirochaetales bacterium]
MSPEVFTAGTKTGNDAGILIETMKKELDLLNLYAVHEEQVQKFIKKRNWKSLEKYIREMDALSLTIQTVEEERVAFFQAERNDLGLPEDAGFYQVAVRYPVAEREELSLLYRNLKLALLRIHGITECIDSYSRTAVDIVQHALKDLFPYRKGNLYSKRGKSVPLDGDALVISHNS